MIHHTAGELDQLQAEFYSSLQDRCIHLKRGQPTPDPATGQDIVLYSEVAVYRCGFDPTASKEQTVNTTGATGLDFTLVIADARLRLPLAAQNVQPFDRFEIIERMGLPLALTQTFEVIGPPEFGQTGVVVNLRKQQV